MSLRCIIAVTVAALLAGCGPADQDRAEPAREPADRAQSLARESIIVDTHIDVPYRLEAQWADVSRATDGGDFDYPRAVAGGLNAPFMSIYTPAGLEETGGSRALAERLIDLVEGIVEASPDKFAIAYSPDDVERHFAEGIISLPLGMENGSPIEGDIANVKYFFDRGIRYITLAHGLSNHISDSSYDDNRRWGGLSDFGREVVAEMNRLGIMIDVSHVSDDAFHDVIALSRAPVIASHSSARHFTPGWERNMADDMIVSLADRGGVIMINFGSAFLVEEARVYGTQRREAYAAYRSDNQLEDLPDIDARFNAEYERENGPYPYATLDQALDHFDHVVALTGVDHVGIGSDYDGVGDSLPIGLKDVSSYPNLIEGLLGRGYGEQDVRKILGENLLRVWREVEAVAAAGGNSPAETP